MKTEEAIRILSNYGVFGCGYCHQGGDEVEESFNMAIEALENSRWIPCSESLPKEREWAGTKKFGTTKSDEVYVTFESPKGERFCRHVCFQNGKLSDYDQSCIDVWFKGSKPIAWMPLPKPYYSMGENYGFPSKEEADLWMDGKPTGKEEI